MSAPRSAFSVQLRNGPKLVLVQLTIFEALDAMRAAGKDALDSAIRRECLRRSLRRVDDKEVGYTDLVGDRLQKILPRTRHQVQGAHYWGRIHEPSPEEVAAALEAVEITDDGEREQWTVALPDGRKVTLQEQPGETVDQALRRASTASASEAVMALTGSLELLRSAIAAIDGHKPPDLAGRAFDGVFTLKEALLLSQVYAELQAGSRDDFAEEGMVRLGEENSRSGR